LVLPLEGKNEPQLGVVLKTTALVNIFCSRS